MAYLGYEQVVATVAVQVASGVTLPGVPANATSVQIQADTQPVRYTMDGVNNPAAGVGMLFRLTDPPKEFLIEDLLRMRWIRDAAIDGNLNLHYFAGRDV